MPRRSTSAVLTMTALCLLALPACSANTPSTSPANGGVSAPVATAPGKSEATTDGPVLSSGQLRDRLLTAEDLGEGYVPKPQRVPGQGAGRDDVTVIGCPALEKLGGEAGAGGSLDFPRRAKAAFTYTGGRDAELSTELYSDTTARLSTGTGRIFAAMASCPVYQVVLGSTPVKVATQKLPAPDLGDEVWSQLLTFTAAGRDSVVKQTAVRAGTVLVVVSGSPALVDTHVEKALAKAAPAA
ncbi:hypothetical protein AB0G74_08405 [Streptomyces sp. NPDC020875]|uniref:hypothetical protein n=1 Tax=Streptomyces sp. NPDC020875 TaxID=3154898 RepID=UPI0033DD6F29